MCLYCTARSAVFGPCYDPSEQISHGGSIFDYGEEIPFYHPGRCLFIPLLCILYDFIVYSLCIYCVYLYEVFIM